MNLYQIFRTIHFYTATLAGVFLLLFFITGHLLGYYNWFSKDHEEPVVETHSVSIPEFNTDRELANWAKKELKLTGKIDWIGHPEEGSTHIEIATPRVFNLVKVSHLDQNLTLETRPQTTYEMLSVIHRMHGYGGGFWYDVYLFMMDLASFSLLIFATTGVYLWLKVIKKKWLGWVFLGMGIIYTSWIVSTFLN